MFQIGGKFPSGWVSLSFLGKRRGTPLSSPVLFLYFPQAELLFETLPGYSVFCCFKQQKNPKCSVPDIESIAKIEYIQLSKQNTWYCPDMNYVSHLTFSSITFAWNKRCLHGLKSQTIFCFIWVSETHKNTYVPKLETFRHIYS